jgi:5'-methylthioadenosine phosphorylase
MNVDVGLIGGTGFYRFLPNSVESVVDTPYGSPSAPLSVATVAGANVAFVPRHGRHHQFLPSEVPYAANLWALRSLGAKQIVAFNTVGSLQQPLRKGHFVLCDQFVDRTSGRRDTIFTGPDGAHISSAEPYCARMREQAIKAVTDLDEQFHPSGTVVVIQGPRFSTRAESKWFTDQGWDVVNMTQFPEVAIARELELCYMNLSYVTDYDVAAREIAAADGSEPVSHAMVIREFSVNEDRIVRVIEALVPALIDDNDCPCHSALLNARVVR